jgi:hypothetical protein
MQRRRRTNRNRKEKGRKTLNTHNHQLKEIQSRKESRRRIRKMMIKSLKTRTAIRNNNKVQETKKQRISLMTRIQNHLSIKEEIIKRKNIKAEISRIAQITPTNQPNTKRRNKKEKTNVREATVQNNNNNSK